MDDLAACLRTWRDRLTPEAVGLPAGGQRRAPGLRREEVAALAGLSVDYLSRLEQGRASHPSVSVLEPLARALRLTDAECEHLFRLAGHGGPAARTLRRHVTPGVQRVLDRLGDVPAMVNDAAWNVLVMNPLAEALLGPYDGDGPHARNALWCHFVGPHPRVVHTPEDERAFEAEAVADLHQTLGSHPDDPLVRGLVDDLLVASPRFAELWAERPVGLHNSGRKTVRHPEVGEIEIDCDVLTVQGSDVRLIVYTAQPGSEAASKLALLAAVGLQTFAQ